MQFLAGHTVEDMVKLRLGECEERIPDIVVFPSTNKIQTHFMPAKYAKCDLFRKSQRRR